VEDDDPQKRLEKVTNESYPNDISSQKINPAAYSRLANKGIPIDVLHTKLVETAANSSGTVPTH
jgi:hypothetical protein